MDANTGIGTVNNGRSTGGGGDWDRVDSRLVLGEPFAERAAALIGFSHVIVIVARPDELISPERPGRLGAAVCELMAVRRGGVVEVRGLDAPDGTVILDVSPYLAEFAARGDVRQPAWATAATVGYFVGVDGDRVIDADAWLAEIARSPDDSGSVEMIVRRPAVGEREVLAVGELSCEVGLVGDNWLERGSSSTPDGSAKADAQLNIMNWRCALLVAGGDPERVALAGDQLFVDLDLSPGNLPAGTRLSLGSAVIEVTAEPHTGCAKFTKRFGLAAHRLINGRQGRAIGLRGICAKVVVPGVVERGAIIAKIGAA